MCNLGDPMGLRHPVVMLCGVYTRVLTLLSENTENSKCTCKDLESDPECPMARFGKVVCFDLRASTVVCGDERGNHPNLGSICE